MPSFSWDGGYRWSSTSKRFSMQVQNFKNLFWQKAYFKWKEPKAFLRVRDAEERTQLRWWIQPLAVLVMVILLLFIWYVNRFNPRKHQSSLSITLIRSVLGAIFFAYAWPWIISFCPSEVRLRETYLIRLRGNSNQQITYSRMEYFAWSSTTDWNIRPYSS